MKPKTCFRVPKKKKKRHDYDGLVCKKTLNRVIRWSDNCNQRFEYLRVK